MRQHVAGHGSAVPLAAAGGAKGPIEIGKGVDVRVEVFIRFHQVPGTGRQVWGKLQLFAPCLALPRPPAEEDQKYQNSEAQKFILLGQQHTGTRSCCPRSPGWS